MIFTQSVGTATDLACKGDFREAIDTLGEHWPGVGVEPERHGTSDLEYARLLLACGILTVELGSWMSTSQQAIAKDLLSRSARLFGSDSGEALARYWLAIAYLRCGENSEALAVTDSILTDQRASCEIVFLAGAVRGLTLMNLGNVAESEQAFASVEVFLAAVPPMTRGRFLLNRGMLYRQTGRFEMALACHEQAIEAFRVAGSIRHQAAARNNIAVVYTEQERYSEAHAATREALAIFEQLGDRAHQAKVLDQIARIYEREQNYDAMQQYAARAVEILSTSDHDGWLVEALITHGVALANLGMEQAKRSLTQALALCNHLTDPKQSKLATDALWKIVQGGNAMREAIDKEVTPIEREVYERMLAAHNGRITPAAHALNLHHHALQGRIERRFPELLKKRRKTWTRRKSLFKKS